MWFRRKSYTYWYLFSTSFIFDIAHQITYKSYSTIAVVDSAVPLQIVQFVWGLKVIEINSLFIIYILHKSDQTCICMWSVDMRCLLHTYSSFFQTKCVTVPVKHRHMWTLHCTCVFLHFGAMAEWINCHEVINFTAAYIYHSQNKQCSHVPVPH